MSEYPYTDGLRALMGKLWVERHVLELLAYRLTCAKLIMAADLRHYVGPALVGVEQVVDKMRVAELDRGLAVAEVAQEWGLPPSELTLEFLARKAPEPARLIFEEHRQAFRQLVGEVEETSLENRRLATSALADIQGTLDALMGAPAASTYGASGRRENTPAPRHISQTL